MSTLNKIVFFLFFSPLICVFLLFNDESAGLLVVMIITLRYYLI